MKSRPIDTPLDCILIVDRETKKRLKINLSDLMIYNVYILDSLREIDETALKKYKKIVVLEDYPKVNSNFVDMKVYVHTLKNFEFYYIGSDSLWCNLLSDLCRTFRMDCSILDYSRLYSVLYNDEALQAEYIVPKELSKVGVDLANEMIETIPNQNVKRMCLEYLTLYSTTEKLHKDNKILNTEVMDLKASLNAERQELGMLYAEHSKLLTDIVDMNVSLRDYETILSRGVYDKLMLSKYSNAPMILYIKNYEELLHMDNFIFTLFNMFTIQARLSCKVLRLHDNDEKIFRTIPANYKIIENKFMESDVISNDFLLRCGDYRTILDILLLNKSRLELLIIVDCKNHLDSIITGDCPVFNLCRDKNHIQAFGLREDNTVTSSTRLGESGEGLCWEDVTQYQEYESGTDKFLTLSTNGAIIQIYNIVKTFYGLS